MLLFHVLVGEQVKLGTGEKVWYWDEASQTIKTNTTDHLVFDRLYSAGVTEVVAQEHKPGDQVQMWTRSEVE